ncbi:DinB family protein [Cytophagaceae bacterium DM2B3-1]|uniref:DinB family protein n=1 Tax=Xanthocytophaga flava TaxID=3048013 RepID=A0ABT7CCW3_9BACT|nr:DinB family protein [Xanthocytophaga flavus]MDJ1491453.1 DinB family protein [Xanthocytophaga flavus]
MTTTYWLVQLYERDLDRLIKEVTLFNDSQNLWLTKTGVTNSAGNLCLHLIGNLNTYLGKQLGNTGYVRDRAAEFSRKDVPVQEILEALSQTKAMVTQVLEQLTESDLEQIYPEQVWGDDIQTGYFLIHLATHLNYHLGQVNYLRRILEAPEN